MEEIKITEEVAKKLLSLVEELDDNPKSVEFRQPVDWKSYGLTDYPVIIQNPMDIGTVREKLKKEEYKTMKEWDEDISLIWNNCKVYNRSGSDIYKQAEFMERLYKKKVGQLKNELVSGDEAMADKSDEETDGDDDSDGISFEEKINLTENVRKLTNKGLTVFVKYVKEHCPAAVSDVDSEKIQVKICDIDKETFEGAKKLVDDHIAKQQEEAT
ncbi:unnamed protein product [Moneuplotes crassus]|uniref:Bromo domain-containing protein n=1 Tax=Euplotes crassus TaxID=5936 RepID=A0AAD1XX40_EUPCR|nr:unnamed protein product [Moneuplotes crassus]